MSIKKSSDSDQSIGSKVIRGAFWTIGMRWLSRFMGLASMVVIARLLTPEDFGIVAVTTALVGLMESFTDLGVDTALIRLQGPQRKHYDTAWTFSIVIHGISAAMIALAGFLSPIIYSDSRYEWVLYTMSLTMLINGIGNPGCIDFRRNLLYHKDFLINILTQLTGVLSTLGLAFLLRSYWALVFGMLVRANVRLLLSYLMHPYRPRFSLAGRSEMLNFSLWIMVRSIAMFLTNKADRLILAASFSPTVIGLYTLAGELASMAVFELLNPIGRVLLPALAAKRNDQQWLAENVKKIFNITASLAVATGVGLAAIAEPALSLIYGARYAPAAPMLVLLSLLNSVIGFNQPIGQFLLLMNKARDFALLYIFEGIVTLSLIYYLTINSFDFQFILYARLGVSVIAFLRLAYLLKEMPSVSLFTVMSAWIRPIIAGAAMFFVLGYFQKNIHGIPLLFLMPILIVLGALVFNAVIFVLWWLMRKPDGIESEILRRVRKK